MREPVGSGRPTVDYRMCGIGAAKATWPNQEVPCGYEQKDSERPSKGRTRFGAIQPAT
jgi:hypothetical protein